MEEVLLLCKLLESETVLLYHVIRTGKITQAHMAIDAMQEGLAKIKAELEAIYPVR
jgi:hypothetical protein